MALADQLLDGYDWDASKGRIEDLLKEAYPDIMALAYDQANGEELPVSVSFDVTNPRVQDTISGLAEKVRSVSDTTRQNIRDIIGTALAGEYDENLDRTVVPSYQEIARRIREAGEIDSTSRSKTIARTETAVALNTGSLLAYRDAGLEQVTVLDGDDDPECSEANGSVWTLEEAEANPIAHPNCVRAFAPGVPKAVLDEDAADE